MIDLWGWVWLIYGNYERQKIKSHKNIVFDMKEQSCSSTICQLTPSITIDNRSSSCLVVLKWEMYNSCFTGLCSEKFSYNCQLIFWYKSFYMTHILPVWAKAPLTLISTPVCQSVLTQQYCHSVSFRFPHNVINCT